MKLIAIYLFPTAALITSGYLYAHSQPIIAAIFHATAILSLPFWSNRN